MPKPVKIVLAPEALSSASAVRVLYTGSAAARDSSEAPAFNTSAHAVPSGYFKSPCCCTINARRNGIIIRMPSRPPITATSITRVNSRSNPRIMIAGIVTPTPNAIDSPAEPEVCTMLFSRMVASRTPILPSNRNRLIEMTATGIDALTVKPTLSTSHNDDAPKTIPSSAPTIKGNGVSSRICTLAGIYGRKVARRGLASGAAVLVSTLSGNSFAPTFAPTLSEDIRFDLQQIFDKNGECAGFETLATLHGPLALGKRIKGPEYGVLVINCAG